MEAMAAAAAVVGVLFSGLFGATGCAFLLARQCGEGDDGGDGSDDGNGWTTAVMAAADGADGLAYFVLAGWTGYLARRMMDGNVFFWATSGQFFRSTSSTR